MPGQDQPPPERDSTELPSSDGGVGFAAIPEPGSAETAPPPPSAEGAMSAAPGTSGTSLPPPDAPVAYVPPPIPPPGQLPPTPPPVEPPKKSSMKLVGAFVAVVAAALGAIFVKFVLPLLLVGAAGQVFDSAFGGPYMRLPGDVRSGFESRLEAALGATLKDQSDAQQTATIQGHVKAGLPRLSTSLVDANFRLTSKAIGAVDVASCAAVSRAVVTGAEPPDAAATAMINTLSDSELQQWFEIRVSAIEAQARGTPDQVLVTDETVAPLYDELFAVMDPANIDTIGKIATGETVEDEALCTAIRDLYASVLTLSTEDALLFAQYDVSP
jgi:hypothetical protein